MQSLQVLKVRFFSQVVSARSIFDQCLNASFYHFLLVEEVKNDASDLLFLSTAQNVMQKANLMMLGKHTTEKNRSLKTQMLIAESAFDDDNVLPWFLS